MDEQDKATMALLASTLKLTRAEIDGMRNVLTAAVATIASDPQALPRFVLALRAVIETGAAMGLTTPVPDEFLQQRAEWIQRLIPEHVKQMLAQP